MGNIYTIFKSSKIFPNTKISAINNAFGFSCNK